MRTVTFYGRPGCHLCDDAMAIVERVRAECPFALVVIDIESDEGLLLAYLEKIPVLAIDGVERFHFFVDEDALRAGVGIVGAP